MVPLAELVSPPESHVAILGEMAAELIHEIRNPLAAIQGHLEMWRGQCAAGRVPEPGGFPVVIQEVASINRLLNNFLSFSKYARQSALACDVAEIARHAVLLLEPEAAKWEIQVELVVEKTPCVRANPYFLARVFINLMRNAFAATPAGGTLKIRVDERPVTDGDLMPVPMAVVEFRDNGPGFAAAGPDSGADWAAVGEAADGAVGRADGYGTETQAGIGLAFCREVLRGYRGSLSIESSASGSCITVLLPCA